MSEQPPTPQPRRSASTRALVLLSILGALVFAGSFGVVLYLVNWEDPGQVNTGSFLEVKLSPEIGEAPTPGGLFLEPDDFPPVVTEIAAAIDRAATDDRIEGLYLRLDNPTLGLAANQELRRSLLGLREAGKPCVAFAEIYDTRSYHLASACDHVVLAPSGITMVTGLSSSTTYYKGTFDKLGIDPEMEHVGDFKSAVEPFERTEPSEAAATATNALLDSLWGQWIREVSEGRGRGPAEIQAWVDRPALSPRGALEQGLVDALAFPDQVRARVTEAGAEDWRQTLSDPVDEVDATNLTPVGEYLKDLRRRWARAPAQVAVVHAAGPIVSGEAGGGLFGEQVIADRTFARWMREIRKDDDVVAVVIRVDSPGGSGLASDLIWREIERTRDTGRPVVVSMAGLAASGGYYMSAPADWVVAQGATLTGSIGVFGGKLNLSGTYEKLGLSQATTKRGAEADLFSPLAPFSEGGREVYREFLSDFYELFLERVAAGRGLQRDEVHRVAQGRVWTGEQALDRGLVDQIGGLADAVAKARELVDDAEVGITRWPKRKGFLELLLEDLEGGTDEVALALLPGVGGDEVRRLMILDRILAGGGVAAWMPGDLRIE